MHTLPKCCVKRYGYNLRCHQTVLRKQSRLLSSPLRLTALVFLAVQSTHERTETFKVLFLAHIIGLEMFQNTF